MDIVGSEGQVLTLGDTSIIMVFTPRRANGGGLSFFIPVMDNGEPHLWATYGNTGAPRSLEDKRLYRQSVQHFLGYMDITPPDVVMSSHPFVDGSLERMQELHSRQPGEPNPFVIGEEAVRNYINILDQCSAVWISRNEAGLNDQGRRL